LVPFATGGFTYILFRDLLPSVIGHARQEKRAPAYALSFLIGLAVMLTISFIAPDDHPETDLLPLPDGFGLA
jgi:zinc transporter ZupT